MLFARGADRIATRAKTADNLCFTVASPLRLLANRWGGCHHPISSSTDGNGTGYRLNKSNNNEFIPNVRFCPFPSAATRAGGMTMAAAKSKGKRKNMSPRVENRIARFRYEILDSYECGIELLGTEVKSIRHGQMSIKEGYARVQRGQIFLHNVNISCWTGAHKAFNHDPIRVRRLLLHKRIIKKLAAKQFDKGLTIIPLCAYFSDNGYLKFEIGLARGKKLHDKREDAKNREAKREIDRAVKAFVSR